MHTICGTHVQCMYMYIHCMYTYMQWTYMFWSVVSTWWVEFHWSPCSWLVTQPLPFLNSTPAQEVWLPCGQLWHCSSRWLAWYEVNQWQWQFGRGKQPLGGLSVEKTGARKKAAQKEQQLLRAAETAGVARLIWPNGKWSCEAAQTCLYYVQTYINIYAYVCTMYIQI